MRYGVLQAHRCADRAVHSLTLLLYQPVDNDNMWWPTSVKRAPNNLVRSRCSYDRKSLAYDENIASNSPWAPVVAGSYVDYDYLTS